jgi:hypothetical protein
MRPTVQPKLRGERDDERHASRDERCGNARIDCDEHRFSKPAYPRPVSTSSLARGAKHFPGRPTQTSVGNLRDGGADAVPYFDRAVGRIRPTTESPPRLIVLGRTRTASIRALRGRLTALD